MPINTIIAQQTNLEQIIVDVAQQYYTDRTNNGALADEFPDFCYDLQQSCNELDRLGQGQNCRYDRPTIGFAYSLRFHLKRFNQWIRFINVTINNWIANDQLPECINVFDVGAGTGSVAWAWNIVLWARAQCNLQSPRVNVYNIDNAAFMIEYNKLLWNDYIASPIGNSLNDVHWTHSINEELIQASQNNCYNILQLSYYFDHTDLTNPTNIAHAQDNVTNLQRVLNIQKVFSLNSASKRRVKNDIWNRPNHPECVLNNEQYVFNNLRINQIDDFVNNNIACNDIGAGLAFYWKDFVNHNDMDQNPAILDI